MRVVVTGANRGIGLELVRQFLARGDSVVAGARDPASATELKALKGTLEVGACDVASDESVASFAKGVKGPVDAVVNNAGIIGKRAAGLAELDFADMRVTFDTNALGALRVTLAFLPHLKEGNGRKVLSVSTGMASISDNTSGGSWGYRMSKAALNMATKNLAHELRGLGISAVAVNPGWVQTDMGGGSASMKVDESARRLIAIVDGLTLEQSGSFLDNDGSKYEY
jgi:NAD(P)-dependent dehydrogenase (short-subunit alcohol dehydrogenase family)